MKKTSPYGVISEKKMEDDDNNDRSIEVIELGGTSDGLINRAKNDDYKDYILVVRIIKDQRMKLGL